MKFAPAGVYLEWKANVNLSIKTRAEYDALLDALDQYVSNQGEFEAMEHEGTESAKLTAARAILETLTLPIIALAEKPVGGEDSAGVSPNPSSWLEKEPEGPNGDEIPF